MRREWKNIADLDAVDVMSPEEAGQVRADPDLRDRILKSRWVLTEKQDEASPAEDPRRLSSKLLAKARWVVLGHTDPDLKEIVTFAPVLIKDGFMTLLQILATFGFKLQLGDVSSAFMSGEYYERQQGPLFASVPAEGIPGLAREILIRLRKAVYGLGDGPLK